MADHYHARQFDGGVTACDGRNCAAASGAMGLHAGSGGATELTADQFRTASGVSCVPGVYSRSGGLFISDVERVFGQYDVVIDYGRNPSNGAPRRWTVDEAESRLSAGYGAVWLGDYDALPKAIRASATFLGDHSSWVHDLLAETLCWHDPLRPGHIRVAWSAAVSYWQKPLSPVRGLAGFVKFSASEEEDPLVKYEALAEDLGGTIRVKTGGASAIPIEGGPRPTVKEGTVRPVIGLAVIKEPGFKPDRLFYLMKVGTQYCHIDASRVDFTGAGAAEARLTTIQRKVAALAADVAND